MANKPLKGINFPGLEDTYLTAGFTTASGGEIFNDYTHNIAEVSCHAEGKNTSAQGIASHTEGLNTKTFNNYAHAEGKTTSANGEASHAEGNETVTSNAYSHAEGNQSKASGNQAHAEGNQTEAKASSAHAEGHKTKAIGVQSHAEGCATESHGDQSHAEGYLTMAYGASSHSEGNLSIAYTKHSHVEGDSTIAGMLLESNQDENQYRAAHAEGIRCIARRAGSHAEGIDSIANANAQHVEGKYNIEDTANKYAHIIGNGSSSEKRSNAHTVDWSGNAWYSGEVYVGGTNMTTGAKKLSKEGHTHNANDILGLTALGGIDFVLLASNASLEGTSSAITINNVANYKAFMIYGQTNATNTNGASNPYMHAFVIKAFIEGSAKSFCLGGSASDSKFFSAVVNNNILTLKGENYEGDGAVKDTIQVYGIK